ncbi:MAG: long-chain fatty acid--CoA ligase, partial [Rhodoferax sp.]|nr:long-chain fatty acid--CoA ligase [Rhodoferax sp.]
MQTTFPQLLLSHAAQRPGDAAMREKEYGIWQAFSWGDMAGMVEQLACGLHQAGLRQHDHMVVIGANRPRLYATMLAVQSLGAVPIALYQDAAALECVFPINNAEVCFAFAEDQEQVDKLLEIREQCPQLKAIYFDDSRGLRNYDEPGLLSLDDLMAQGKSYAAQNNGFFKAAVDKVQPDDVAAMFFTSGTTGNPKGVVHTHDSLLNRARAGAEFDKLTHAEDVLAYLPPAWIGQNIFSYAQWLSCGYVVNCPEDASTVHIDLKEIGPTYYFAPPRVFEGMLTSVMIRMEDAGSLKRNMFHYFMKVAKKVGPTLMDGKSVSVIDRVLYALGNF